MTDVSKVTFIGKTTELNIISTNRVTSTFKIIGGPREPGYFYLIRNDSTGDYDTLDLKPQYAGQLVYSNTVEAFYDPIKYKARLFVAIEETEDIFSPETFSYGRLKWVPVVNYYHEYYIDTTTGKEWDPVAGYVCDPPYLCPENP